MGKMISKRKFKLLKFIVQFFFPRLYNAIVKDYYTMILKVKKINHESLSTKRR